MATVSKQELAMWLKLATAEEFLYTVSITLPKLCILALYLRIFTPRPCRLATYLVGGVIMVQCVACIIAELAYCQPFEYNWDKTIPGGGCGDILALYRWVSVPNLVTDLAILVIPQKIIWDLHTGKTQKIKLVLTFLTGSVGTIAAVFRFVSFFQTDLFADPTWYGVKILTWTIVEPGIYLIAACLPCLRPLAGSILKAFGFSNNSFQVPSRVGTATKVNTNNFEASNTTTKRRTDIIRTQRSCDETLSDENCTLDNVDNDIKRKGRVQSAEGTKYERALEDTFDEDFAERRIRLPRMRDLEAGPPEILSMEHQEDPMDVRRKFRSRNE